jgi:beta-ribofuranosylaminobenzene 5'-phosphate synthase
MNYARNLDYQDRELKAYLLLMDLIPAQERAELKRIGDLIWENRVSRLEDGGGGAPRL